MADDRVCDLRSGCHCVTRGVRDDGSHFDKKKRDACEHFHFPSPGMISKRTTKRSDLRDAGEYSILNNRPFSEQPLPGDYTPAQIRKGVKPEQVMGMEKAGRGRAILAKREAERAAARREIAIRQARKKK